MGKRFRPRGRDIDGILLLDKITGITSNEALQEVKRLFFAKKAGHTGSLDPLACGMLPICFGEATKFSQFLLNANKRYVVTAQMGVQTATGDAEGEVIATKPVPSLDEAKLEKVLDQFRGDIQQVPSMYSALKHKGQPLYKLARQGIEVERAARPVTIFEMSLTSLQPDSFSLELLCSKGTYVRTLVEDIGHALGCGAHVTALRRPEAGPFLSHEMVDFESLEKIKNEDGNEALDKVLLPVDALVRHWPIVKMSSAAAFYIQQGEPVIIPQAPTSGWVRLVIGEGQQFIGVGEIQDDGRVAPRRLITSRAVKVKTESIS